MKVWAISDLHLSLAQPKEMDIFGEHWENHWEKIQMEWRANVGEDDLTLVAGDLSWAMTYDAAKCDLQAILGMPGQKVLIKGNHDYWHGSLARTRALLDEKTFFLQNDCFCLGEFAVAGARGWKQRSDADFTQQDEKIYARELLRLEASLKAAKRKGGRLLGMMHYPPFEAAKKPSAMTELFAAYGVEKVVYGHIHGRPGQLGAFRDFMLEGVEYMLTSCDFLDFAPRRIV